MADVKFEVVITEEQADAIFARTGEAPDVVFQRQAGVFGDQCLAEARSTRLAVAGIADFAALVGSEDCVAAVEATAVSAKAAAAKAAGTADVAPAPRDRVV